MNSDSLQIETEPVDGCNLRVVWQAKGDRWSHQIYLFDAAKETLLLRSINAGPNEDWPPSAVIQECHQQSIGERPALFGVGMAGTSHWSVAVESSDTSLKFDFACRVKQPPHWLGSTYEWNPDVSVASARRATIAQTNVSLHIATDDTENTEATLNEIDQLEIQSAPESDKPSVPATFRWRYQITIKSLAP